MLYPNKTNLLKYKQSFWRMNFRICVHHVHHDSACVGASQLFFPLHFFFTFLLTNLLLSSLLLYSSHLGYHKDNTGRISSLYHTDPWSQNLAAEKPLCEHPLLSHTCQSCQPWRGILQQSFVLFCSFVYTPPVSQSLLQLRIGLM